MEPVSGVSGERTGLTTLDRADEAAGVTGPGDPAFEPFEATIVRLDQSTAEEIFRLAAR